MCVKNDNSEQRETQAIVKSIWRLVTALQSGVQVLQAGNERLETTKKEITAQVFVSAKSGSNIDRFENEKVPAQLIDFALSDLWKDTESLPCYASSRASKIFNLSSLWMDKLFSSGRWAWKNTPWWNNACTVPPMGLARDCWYDIL